MPARRGCRKYGLPIALALIFFVFAAHEAQCASFDAFGHWMFGLYAGNVYGQRHRDVHDPLQAVQRLRTQFGFSTDSGTSGQIQLEMGKTNWGQFSSGGALGVDNFNTKLRYAWLEWLIPAAGTRVRMGLQPVNMPAFVNGSPLFSEDAAALTLSQSLGENLSATFFWARASSDNENPNRHVGLPDFDSLDYFGLALPVRGNSWRITPYGMYANAGKNSFGYGRRNAQGFVMTAYKSSLRTAANSLMPVGGYEMLADPALSGQLYPWGSAWWAGLGGQIDSFEPWRLAGELAWGLSDFGQMNMGGKTFEMRRWGWYAAALAEYRLENMSPGLLGWYASGDDGNPWNGSERMPFGKSANRDWKVLNLAYDGAPFCPAGGAQILSPDGNMIGTLGLVGRVRDIAFVRGISHTVRVGYVRGTNNPSMVRHNPFFRADEPGAYLTWQDDAYEIDLETRVKIFENLTLVFDADWLRVNWSNSVWSRVDNNLVRDFYRLGFTAYFHF